MWRQAGKRDRQMAFTPDSDSSAWKLNDSSPSSAWKVDDSSTSLAQMLDCSSPFSARASKLDNGGGSGWSDLAAWKWDSDNDGGSCWSGVWRRSSRRGGSDLNLSEDNFANAFKDVFTKKFTKLMPHDSRALHPAMMVNWAVLLIGQINMLRGRTAKLYSEISTIQPTSAAIAEGNFTAACVLCTMLREERSCDDQNGQLWSGLGHQIWWSSSANIVADFSIWTGSQCGSHGSFCKRMPLCFWILHQLLAQMRTPYPSGCLHPICEHSQQIVETCVSWTGLPPWNWMCVHVEASFEIFSQQSWLVHTQSVVWVSRSLFHWLCMWKFWCCKPLVHHQPCHLLLLGSPWLPPLWMHGPMSH